MVEKRVERGVGRGGLDGWLVGVVGRRSEGLEAGDLKGELWGCRREWNLLGGSASSTYKPGMLNFSAVAGQ